jgi:hypothetical protein
MAGNLCSTNAHSQLSSAPVPIEFSDLYSSLDTKLQEINRYIASRWSGEKSNVLFATELLAANGNQGEHLLREQAFQTVVLNLDRLQLLGIRGVKVGIKYPLLVPGFPRSAEYLNFYKRVAEELRKRSLKFLVQTTPTFIDPTFSSLPVAPYYAGLTLERYKQEQRQMAETIIREIRPDYLTIENEPGTTQANTGLPITVQSYTEIVQHVLSGLDRAGVQIGAGTGTWDNPAYLQSLAQYTTLDYIDLHLYPINRDFVIERAITMAATAKQFNKKVLLGEAWLYKTRDRELGGAPVAAAAGLFSRDVFRFWEPLDVQFIQTIFNLSHYLRLEFTCFFWMRYFFGYVEYNEGTKRLTPTELFRLANQEASKNMLATPPKLTQTGLTFQKLLSQP